DDNTLRVDTDAGAQARMLRFAAPAAPGAKTWQGTTTAIWELPPGSMPGGAPDTAVAETGGAVTRGAPRMRFGQLKTVTTNMRAGYLRKNGVPYSENAVL